MTEQPITDAEIVTPTIAPELTEKVQALRALATTHSLLDAGLFQVAALPMVAKSLQFVQALHKQMADEVCAHPDSDLVEELKPLKSARAEATVTE